MSGVLGPGARVWIGCMMRFRCLDAPVGTVLTAEIEGADIGIQTDPLGRDERALQARALIDAAAALLEDDVGYEAAFDALHDVLDDLPQAQREAP